jgi:hypothetical protein
MNFLLIVALMTADGVKFEHIKEPDMQTCEVVAISLNAFDKVRADCVEVNK